MLQDGELVRPAAQADAEIRQLLVQLRDLAAGSAAVPRNASPPWARETLPWGAGDAPGL